MPTLAEKKATVEEIRENLEQAGAIYVTNYSGMSVSTINELRGEFFKSNVTYKVYKNTLMKRAMEEKEGYDDLYPHLVEQNGFAFVDEAFAAPAKVLKKFMEDNGKPQFKAALIDGEYYDESRLGELAAMKSKEEVLGDIAALLLAPVSNIVRALNAPGEKLAGALKSIAEQGE
ncbi:MAG: 50S ribosomal protein L10 [Balneolaceae bacterium]|nr:50S ribosomal protein L10 [Balneolaceae bacterium]